MKNVLVLIGLFVTMGISAQTFFWDVRSHGKNDTTAYDTRPDGNNWLFTDVTVDITIWNLEDITGSFYIGGYDNKVTAKIGKQDFKYYVTIVSDDDLNPIVADTTGTFFAPNSDSTRWGAKLVFPDFASKKPAFQYIKGTTDSLEYYILFNAVK